MANPVTNAATAQNTANPDSAQCAAVATTRKAGPPNSAAQAPLAMESSVGRGGGVGGM
jgi:hypothetical protein